MSTPDKCPHCGEAVETCFVRLDGGTQAPVMLKCHSVKGSGTITHSILCQESAARQKAEAERDEAKRDVEFYKTCLESLQSNESALDKASAICDAHAPQSWGDDDKGEFCTAIQEAIAQAFHERDETRRKLEEVIAIARPAVAAWDRMLVAFDGADDSARRNHADAMESLSQWLEKGGAV